MTGKPSVSNVSVDLRVRLRRPPPDHLSLYVAGNHPALGDWKPDAVPLRQIGPTEFRHEFSVARDTLLELKITRGSWKQQAIYAGSRSFPPNNVVIRAKRSGVRRITVTNWLDKTATVTDPILGALQTHAQLTFPGLDYPHDLSVWLPPDYSESDRQRFPVLYMHDGQNLFDPAQSFCGHDWKVDETMVRLSEEGVIQPAIVVGISNSPDRMEELNLLTRKGRAYRSFLVEQVKPFIDTTYRTMPAREWTGIMGSSMGGLVSFQLAWQHPDVFSFAGCLSPAFWKTGAKTVAQVRASPCPDPPIRIYLDAGEYEPPIVAGLQQMLELLQDKGFRKGVDLLEHFEAGANHSEAAWSARLFRPLTFFLGALGVHGPPDFAETT